MNYGIQFIRLPNTSSFCVGNSTGMISPLYELPDYKRKHIRYASPNGMTEKDQCQCVGFPFSYIQTHYPYTSTHF